ncbi:MAG: amidohydrolase family protein [Candidatus Omnitrophica bacterium]|nr:amidohydrolase family protein [Candidatus Omnitrophota bacterium]
MRIINSHVHMIEIKKVMQKMAVSDLPTGITMFDNLQSTLALINTDVLFAQMDEAGITKSVLFGCDAPILYSSNEYVAALCKKHPERLIGFASVDPKRKDAAAIIESAIKKLGLRGIKFHPPLQNFYPNDEKVFPIYEMAMALKVPIVFHVGSTPFGNLVRLDQANPILLDEVACKFPQLKIILTHLGTLWSDEAFMVVEKNSNVYIDTAAYVYEIPQLLTVETVARLGPKKLIFGTDYPTPFGGKTHKMKDFVEAIQNLKLPKDIIEGIFFNNLQNLLGGKI